MIQSHWHFVMFKSSQLLGALLALLGHVDSGQHAHLLLFNDPSSNPSDVYKNGNVYRDGTFQHQVLPTYSDSLVLANKVLQHFPPWVLSLSTYLSICLCLKWKRIEDIYQSIRPPNDSSELLRKNKNEKWEVECRYVFVHERQCDQITKLFFHHLAIYNNKN